MTDIESIFAKRQQLNELRLQSFSLPAHLEADHETLFNKIWRLTTELKVLETAVANGVEPSRPKSDYKAPINLYDDDMGDDFTKLPVDPIGTDRPESVDLQQQKINGILFVLEMLSKMPETDSRNKEIETLQKELCKYYQ